MRVENILVDPYHKTPLKIDRINGEILNLDKTKFEGRVEGDIPIILPKSVDSHLKSTELHKQSKSTFDYIEHYTIDAEVFDYFDNSADKIVLDERNRLNQYILNLFPNIKSQRILDVGCGNSWLSQAVQNDYNEVISLDISVVNTTKALLIQPHKNHSALVADVFHLPLQDESIDVIVASEIMEHLSDPAKFIQHLLVPLKKGGKIIITTPYNEKIPMSLCVHCNHPTPANAHLHSFNETNISKLIPKNITRWKCTTISNKYMLKLRIYLLISFMPFVFWKFLDTIANKIIKKPIRLVIEIIK